MIRAIWRNGQFVPDEPVDLPEEAVVYFHEVPHQDECGAEDESMSPDEIAQTRAAMDQVEPLNWTDSELSGWEKEKQAGKRWEKDRFFDRGEKLRETSNSNSGHGND